jgi:formylmethanofuran dehydrogenase subunit E
LSRNKLRNPRKLFNRKCDKCGKEIKSTYSQNRGEIIYCEECYNGEM